MSIAILKPLADREWHHALDFMPDDKADVVAWLSDLHREEEAGHVERRFDTHYLFRLTESGHEALRLATEDRAGQEAG